MDKQLLEMATWPVAGPGRPPVAGHRFAAGIQALWSERGTAPPGIS